MSAVDAYAAMLDAEGLIVDRSADSGGGFSFRFEGDTFDLLTYADDPAYVGISASYRLPAGVSRALALRAANDATRRSKVVKAYLHPDRGVTIAAELFLDDPTQLQGVIFRLLLSVQTVSAEFFSQVLTKAKA